MYDKKRVFKIIVALTVLLSVLLYAAFIFTHLDHDCPGEDCEICAVIALCRTNLSAFGIALTLLFALSLFSVLIISQFIEIRSSNSERSSLVSMKVKLSD